MIHPATVPPRPSHPLLGAAVAASVLLALFLGALLLRGSSYFEWGFWPSLGLAWMAVVVGYVAGAALIYLLWWAALRAGVRTRPSLVLFGALVVVAMWFSTEVSPVAEWSSRMLPWSAVLVVAVVLSAAVTIVAGFRGQLR